ncbi:hypothetical protein [Metabacillus halosaccharovorans]|uniref:hypothetical protein n=1 Tax=Metabacillus halosaccharovorans TaxID=930124 RepID=UPI000995BE4F|nr:hypothetical protein [Metabacillus halosaccharovorans]
MDKKLKRFISYLFFTTILLIIIFLGLRYQSILYTISKENYDLFPYLRFKAIFPLFLGVFIAIPHIFKAIFKTGEWYINWIRLVVLSFPFLYASVVPVLYLTGIINMSFPFLSYIMGGYFGNEASTTFETINGIIAGYVVFTSIDKKVQRKDKLVLNE